MNLNHIDRLAATVPATVQDQQRARLRGYVETASRCEARIQWLRGELELTLQANDLGVAASAAVAATPNAALTLACELDALERLQPRVDAWLTDYVAALVVAHPTEIYGDDAPF